MLISDSLPFVRASVSRAGRCEIMRVWEFVCKWVPLQGRRLNPEDWRFKAEAAKHLSETIEGISSPTSISAKWGKQFDNPPEWVPLLLEKEDILRDIQRRVEQDHPKYQLIPEKQELISVWDFACKWVPLQGRRLNPGDWGFKAEAAKHLSETIGGISSPTSISAKWSKDFSKTPRWVPLLLNKEDALRDICQRVRNSGTPSSTP